MICELTLNSVLLRLKNAAGTEPSGIPGIRPADISILPEGKVPAIAGQRFITAHAESITTLNPIENWRKRQLRFNVTVIRRIRDIPADRFDLIYTKENELSNTHEILMTLIESLAMFTSLVNAFAAQNYSITGTFTHKYTQLNPIHLYPGFFNSSDESVDKIAGYRTYSSFTSPVFRKNTNPLTC